jgi:nitrate/TMAO reductase-like tetraheme cytochrome c subunit
MDRQDCLSSTGAPHAVFAYVRLGTGIIVLGVLIGIAAGIGSYTFIYAKGYSYLGHDPAACANCHVMGDYYAAWLKGPHRSVAACVWRRSRSATSRCATWPWTRSWR